MIIIYDQHSYALCKGEQCPDGTCAEAGEQCPTTKGGEKTPAEKLADCKKTYGEGGYCECKLTLKGIYLNTQVPFVGTGKSNRCLVMSTAANAPTTVLQMLTKIMMTFVMIGGFGAIVWAGVMIASSGSDDTRQKKGLGIIKGVAIAFALLGSLGVILRFINPNFFS